MNFPFLLSKMAWTAFLSYLLFESQGFQVLHVLSPEKGRKTSTGIWTALIKGSELCTFSCSSLCGLFRIIPTAYGSILFSQRRILKLRWLLPFQLKSTMPAPLLSENHTWHWISPFAPSLSSHSPSSPWWM